MLAAACADEPGARPPAGDPGSGPDAAAATVAPGTAAMAERLGELDAELDPEAVPYASARRAAALRARGAPADPRRRVLYRLRLAEELLNAGRPDAALRELEDAERLLESGRGGPATRDLRLEILRWRGIAHVRRGIEQNALATGTGAPWRVPLSPTEAHPRKEPWEAATVALEAALEEEPEELLVARWLLNLAHMALGRHPDGVPPRWLIPPAAFAPEHDVGTFRNRAAEAGVDVVGLAGGAVLEDFDGDADFDLVVSSRGLRDPLRYFRNEGDGTFREASDAAGLKGLTGGLNLKPADYDNDGNVDVLVLRGAWMPRGWPNSLLRNEGDGTFADVTREAGVYSERPTQTADWGDYDNDGDLDLYVGNETPGAAAGPAGEFGPSPVGRAGQPAELFRNEGNGRFTEVADELGAAVLGFVKGVAWGDYDNDGWADLYVSRLDGPNLLLRNLRRSPAAGHGGFRDVAAEAGVTEPLSSFPIWWWDYDNDGWLDLLVIGRGGGATAVAAEHLGLPPRHVPPRLYHNLGAGPDGRHRGFEDVTRPVGLDRVVYAMGSNHGDFDNDGWPDFLAGTGNPLLYHITPTRAFRSADGRRFQDVGASGGFGYLWKGHGVSFGDFDADGDQDAYVVYGGAFEGDRGRNVLLENPGHGNAWLTIRLVGVESNRYGLGSRIRVAIEAPGGAREIHHLVGSGGSFGANTLQAEIGLGDATRIRELEVRWAGSGRRDVFRRVPLDRIVIVREGARSVTPVDVTTARLGGPPAR